MEQCARDLGEKPKEPYQEAHHSVRPIPLPRDQEAGHEHRRANPDYRKRKERINWPSQQEKDKLKRGNEDIDTLLETTLRGDVDMKMRKRSSVIY